MSQENVEIVRRIYEAWQSEEILALSAHAHPDIEIAADSRLSVGTGGTFHGDDGVSESGRELLDALREMRCDPSTTSFRRRTTRWSSR